MTSDATRRQSKVLVENKTKDFKCREFPQNVNLQKGIDRLSYGIGIRILLKKVKSAKNVFFFYINEEDSSKLQWISNSKGLHTSRLDLCTVSSVSESPSFPLPKKLKQFMPLLLTIFHGGTQELLLIFKSPEEKIEWWAGLEYFIRRAQDYRRINPVSSPVEMAHQLFDKADLDGNNVLEKNEIKKILKQMQMKIDNKTLNAKIEAFDTDKNGTIDKKEFETFIQSLLRKKELSGLFKRYSRDYKETDDEPVMTAEELVVFYKEEQKTTITQPEAVEIILQIKKGSVSASQNYKDVPKLSFYDFGTLIFSNWNLAFNPEHTGIYMDLTRPLTDYYMKSSHNTYLIGNQLTGTSSIKGYIRALELGCRSIEIDLWNGDHAEPIVTHGHTLTSKILFKDLVVALKEHAFVRSEYPLILSFEMHCDVKGQEKIASILEAEIKDQIYVLPEDFNSKRFYPSLESLKRKFVIKSKGSVPVASHTGGIKFGSGEQIFDEPIFDEPIFDEQIFDEPSLLDSDNDDPRIDLATLTRRICLKVNMKSPSKNVGGLAKAVKKQEEEERKTQAETVFKQDYDHNTNNYVHSQLKSGQVFLEDQQKEITQQQILPQLQEQKSQPGTKENKNSHDVNPDLEVNILSSHQSDSKRFQTEENEVSPDDIKIEEGKKKKKEKKVKAYEGLTKYYTLFGSKMSFSAPRTIWEISSLSEDKIKSLLKSSPKQIIDFCKKYFVRVYPLGTRVDSSNYDPVKAWTVGGQMVALNYQTSDESMLLNYAKYTANGGIGYVLKPEYLTSVSLTDPSKAKYPNEMTAPKMRIKIRVISGQQFRCEEEGGSDIIDPFVEIKLRGIDLDEENNAVYKTHTVRDNGFNPIWSTEEKVCEKEFTIVAPELACLVFKVFDANLTKNTKLAWYAIEVPHMISGHRVLPMLNSRFDQIPYCYLYAHITIEHLDEKVSK